MVFTFVHTDVTSGSSQAPVAVVESVTPFCQKQSCPGLHVGAVIYQDSSTHQITVLCFQLQQIIYFVHEDGAGDAAAPGDALRLQCTVIRHNHQLHLSVGYMCMSSVTSSMGKVDRRFRMMLPCVTRLSCLVSIHHSIV